MVWSGGDADVAKGRVRNDYNTIGEREILPGASQETLSPFDQLQQWRKGGPASWI